MIKDPDGEGVGEVGGVMGRVWERWVGGVV